MYWKLPDDPIMAAHDLTKEWISDHIRIIFNGNGYSEEWVKEAERRGLPNIRNMVDTLSCLTDKSTIELFERHKVMTRVELTSRQEVGYESYAKSHQHRSTDNDRHGKKRNFTGSHQIHNDGCTVCCRRQSRRRRRLWNPGKICWQIFPQIWQP